jgi:hypothetical protein
MRNPPKKILCSFCNRQPEDVVFRSPIGGEPPVICGKCVAGYYLLLSSAAFTIKEVEPNPGEIV